MLVKSPYKLLPSGAMRDVLPPAMAPPPPGPPARLLRGARSGNENTWRFEVYINAVLMPKDLPIVCISSYRVRIIILVHRTSRAAHGDRARGCVACRRGGRTEKTRTRKNQGNPLFVKCVEFAKII